VTVSKQTFWSNARQMTTNITEQTLDCISNKYVNFKGEQFNDLTLTSPIGLHHVDGVASVLPKK